MIEEVTDDSFQIVHGFSSMVLELVDKSVKLEVNKVKNSQTFYL